MTSKLPSGFKTREEYNKYMRNYNHKYRNLVREMRNKKNNRLAFLEWENQRLQKCLKVALSHATLS